MCSNGMLGDRGQIVQYHNIQKGEPLNEVIEGHEKFGFPNCEGAIDGTHITIIAPKGHRADIFLWNDQSRCLLYNLCKSTRQETYRF